MRVIEYKALLKLGRKIRSIRESKNLTLEDMEERGFPTWQHWQKIEAGQKDITLSTLIRIARALRIKSSELLQDI